MAAQFFMSGRSSEPASGAKPIPVPPGLPFLGNIGDIDRELPLRSFVALAEKYGEIYRLNLPGRTMVVNSSHRLINELCDEKRFIKIPKGALDQIRNGVHDGLFTARPNEPNWAIAHRILMPARAGYRAWLHIQECDANLNRFGPVSIRGMFGEMHDVATQLALKFARHGPTTPIAVTEDFTRLALDTLALCSMGYRFNSYYTTGLHPFIEAMGDFLTVSGTRASRPMPDWFYRAEDAKYFQDIEVLRKTAMDVLRSRKEQPNDRKDLLNAMLNGVDSKTGQRMTDESIIDNLITFLIAGHETTSGTLSFAFHELMKNPEAYRKAQKEVDEVVGKGPITVEHMSKVPYISAILRETLRLDSPITIFSVVPVEDTLLAGQYPVYKDEAMMLFVKQAHVDPAVYGDDAHEFKPERMLDEQFHKLPKNAWKPFGNGARGCIGRPFAIQEATLAMVMLLQNFNFVMDDPTYRLSLKQTLTIKPDGFYMRAILRDGLTPSQLEHRLAGTEIPPSSAKHQGSGHSPGVSADGNAQLMRVLYGSNSGTCESLAHQLARDASLHGFKADVDSMDAANGALPRNQPVIIITASYEGQAPDNAAHFVSWAENGLDKTSLDGTNYAVFGVGHHDWAHTFHRIPKLMDSKLAEAGATRLAPIGLADVASSDTFTDFETWEDNVLWPALKKQYGAGKSAAEHSHASGLNVTVTSPRTSTLRQDVLEGLVVATRRLTAEGEPLKKHIEIALPSGETYRAGDYLAVLPVNPKETIQRVLRQFHLPWDAHITIAGDGQTVLPTNTSNVSALSDFTKNVDDQASLKRLANEDYQEVFQKRISVLDLLEKFTSVDLPLGNFIGMLPPMRVRQYSISSSPLWNPSHVTLTFSVLEAPSKAGEGTYVGVASSYLDSLAPGDKLHVSVRQSHAAFHLPQDVEKTPIICIAAGTGLAPFRGFIQERAEMLSAGRNIAPAILLVGCRAPGCDDLYADELAKWEKIGAVTVKRAYSRATEKSNGQKYVQDVLRERKDEVLEYWKNGAKLYICGSRAVGEGVKAEMVKMKMDLEKKNGNDMTEEEARNWWEEMRNARYATDVFD
ncbi:Uu.00g076350.m01.CDS01 [Anthostomella pinea]|uniref:Bifunctional cytochrome P450/NADPH--P450 reductase n=1 Tax=Anthostomella pinea TaxID=933095 RepID=A0AAI8VWF1_9PEZI|nr:Uu.00g076350.m01.CDS01 [Anthostomella pinea]